MQFLVFQLVAPMAAWGDVAVGQYRGSRDAPGESALLGLLAAALGIRRDDEAAHAALRDGYAFAVGTVDPGSLLRDYHTAQVPSRGDLKGRPHRTRRDELAMPKHALNTILSARDYRQGGAWIVAVQPLAAAPHEPGRLERALREPRFTLYLGRKSCPPAAPLAPQVIDAESAHAAIAGWLQACGSEDSLRSLAWGDRTTAGAAAHLSVPRKDRLIRRKGWLFGDRTEHVALFKTGD
ncbi:MAG: type I-E CRISPR-associated protein Cas5/CasD [Sinobacteraceae bacterium]|nr:type I-E CRISPR-associated protein Cas5/CasD [Nevskiaceae bacterium]